MHILIRGVGNYLEVTVKNGAATLELDLLDKDERITLASTLSAAIYELLDGLEDA